MVMSMSVPTNKYINCLLLARTLNRGCHSIHRSSTIANHSLFHSYSSNNNEESIVFSRFLSNDQLNSPMESISLTTNPRSYKYFALFRSHFASERRHEHRPRTAAFTVPPSRPLFLSGQRAPIIERLQRRCAREDEREPGRGERG